MGGIGGLWMLLLGKYLNFDFLASVWVKSFIHPPMMFLRFLFCPTAEFQVSFHGVINKVIFLLKKLEFLRLCVLLAQKRILTRMQLPKKY